jgi:large subunit ribosomal protein L22
MANYISTWRFAKIAPRKARLVADLIRGKSVDEAFDLLKFSKKRAAVMVGKVLKSAVANADSKQVDVGDLFVSDSFCDPGPIVKRMMPKDRGKSYRILKRTSHITIGVAPGAEARAEAAVDRKKNKSKPRAAKVKAA